MKKSFKKKHSRSRTLKRKRVRTRSLKRKRVRTRSLKRKRVRSRTLKRKSKIKLKGGGVVEKYTKDLLGTYSKYCHNLLYINFEVDKIQSDNSNEFFKKGVLSVRQQLNEEIYKIFGKPNGNLYFIAIVNNFNNCLLKYGREEQERQVELDREEIDRETQTGWERARKREREREQREREREQRERQYNLPVSFEFPELNFATMTELDKQKLMYYIRKTLNEQQHFVYTDNYPINLMEAYNSVLVRVPMAQDSGSFGLEFKGPKDLNEGQKNGFGIYISEIKEGSAASYNDDLFVGQEVISINNQDLTNAALNLIPYIKKYNPMSIVVKKKQTGVVAVIYFHSDSERGIALAYKSELTRLFKTNYDQNITIKLPSGVGLKGELPPSIPPAVERDPSIPPAVERASSRRPAVDFTNYKKINIKPFDEGLKNKATYYVLFYYVFDNNEIFQQILHEVILRETYIDDVTNNNWEKRVVWGQIPQDGETRQQVQQVLTDKDAQFKGIKVSEMSNAKSKKSSLSKTMRTFFDSFGRFSMGHNNPAGQSPGNWFRHQGINTRLI